MASQRSDIQSTLNSDQFEDLDSSSVGLTTSLSSRKQRIRTSKIWDHTPGTRTSVYINSSGKGVWRCAYCLKEYLETSGTRTISQHLLVAHEIELETAQAEKAAKRQSNIDDAFLRGQETSYKRRLLSIVPTQTLDPATLEILYVRWISACGIAFRMVEIEEFRDLIQYLNKEVNNHLPKAHATIQSWTIRTYRAEKVRIRQKVQSALSKVHFTTDLWTSPNSLAILGIIGHYIAEDGQLQHSVLALQELDGKHSG